MRNAVSVCILLGLLAAGAACAGDNPQSGRSTDNRSTVKLKSSKSASKDTQSAERPKMLWADTSRKGRPYSKDPSVVRFQGRYLMYFSLPPGGGFQGWTAGIAQSDDLVRWEKAGEITPAAEYEAKGLAAPDARVLDGKVHLFYQTYGNKHRDAICHAWSEDGIRFTRNPTNPVFHPEGDWTVGRAIDAHVYPVDGRLLLYYATRDPGMKVQMLGVAAAPLDSDFQRDAWTQLTDGPILQPELAWEKNCIEAPTVCEHNGRLYMFYAGAYNNEPQQVGCAVSDDGVRWTRLFDEPLLPNGPEGAWNSSESGHPGVFVDEDGATHLFYQGNDDHGETWLLSKVRIGWRDGKPFVESRQAVQVSP